MKRLFLYLLALLPVISVVSLLLLAILLFPITLLPNSILPVAPIYIVEIILGILLGLYGFRLRRMQIDNKLQIIYWIILGASAGVLLLLKYRLIILLQPLLPIIYAIVFEHIFISFKKYVQKSRDAFVVLNSFDAFFIGFYFLLKFIIKCKTDVINSFLNKLSIPQDDLELIIIILTLIVLFVLIPAFRGCLSVWFYKEQNGIRKQFGKVFWNLYLKSYFASFISICLYATLFFQLDTLQFSTILVFLIYMSLNIYFWMYVYEGIDRGGDDKKEVILNWVLIGLVSIFLVLLDQIESDLIGILTWFLPILLPIFIGEVNSIIPRGYLKTPTSVMKKHIYWLQMMSFNTLLVFNIVSSIFTKQILKKNQMEQINSLKLFLISVLDRGTSSNFTLGIFVSFIMLLCSMAIAYVLSKVMIYLIRRTYIETSNRYFN